MQRPIPFAAPVTSTILLSNRAMTHPFSLMSYRERANRRAPTLPLWRTPSSTQNAPLLCVGRRQMKIRRGTAIGGNELAVDKAGIVRSKEHDH